MNEHTPKTVDEIPAERWLEWCDIFTDGNRGRSLSVSLVDDEFGAETLAERVLMVAIERNSVSKESNLIITYGDQRSPTLNIISAPVSLWQIRDANGVVAALEIEDQNGIRTILTFD